jgi:hypothetical protein
MRAALTCILVLAAGLAPAVARGQVSTEISGMEKSKEYFERGIILYKAGDYKGALENFLTSYDLRPHPKLKYNIGLCYLKLGYTAKALNEWQGFISKEKYDIEPEIADTLSEIMATVVVTVGKLFVNVDVDGAAVTVDGESFGESPLGRPVFVEPGKHVVTVTGPGGAGREKSVTLGVGETREIHVALADGPEKMEPDQAKKDKHKKEKKKKKKTAGPAAMSWKKPERKKVIQGFFYLALGLTAGALGAATGTGILAMQKKDDIKALDEACRADGCNQVNEETYLAYRAKRSRLYDEGKSFGDASTYLFAAAGALAVTGIVLFVFSRPLIEKKAKGSSRTRFPALAAGQGPSLVLSW